MTSRRNFLKHAALGGAASTLLLSDSIRRAFAIDPAPRTTFMDAEHIVILMQENRSFDHLYGSLRGVRGFDDPRAAQLPNGNPVWCQSNKKGETFAPFRLDIKNTKVTWLGSLPHSWTDQTDARNHGKHDGWLDAKKSGRKECAEMPFTMGAYTRDDVPFYYDLADAFTICDQHFCSSLTGTMPNRLYLWSGTIRGTRDASGRARVNNGDIEYENSCAWKTFPDRLEDLGVSWKVYQNEISAVDVGFTTEEAAWLANYGDNPLEWFPQFQVGFSSTHRAHLEQLIATLPSEIEKLKNELASRPEAAEVKKALAKAEASLQSATERRAKFSPENFDKLSSREKNLFAKALSTNAGDPDYRRLTTLTYQDGAKERRLKIPKGDVFDQFRKDVSSGQLPTVSWIVAPENFSDHPSSAWFGAWYVSEALNILTQNPEVWKKTIFILTYDENDGYFDHFAPFTAPHPHKPETGAVSEGVSVEEDFVTMEEELKTKQPRSARESSIGLGFRVPMVIASPWSRGGYVCSQVFDHTSSLQFLEKFLSQKLGRPVREPNISDWRRIVCGDLTSSFRPYRGEKIPLPPFLQKEPFLESIHKAQFMPAPTGFKGLSENEIKQIRDGHSRGLRLQQESGNRPSTSLPYELQADGSLNKSSGSFEITFVAGRDKFGDRSAGGAFYVVAPGSHKSAQPQEAMEKCRMWNFAVRPGSSIKYSWKCDDFENGLVHLRIYGPNGFYREFRVSKDSPMQVRADLRDPNKAAFTVANSSNQPLPIELTDNAYGAKAVSATVPAGKEQSLQPDLKRASGWYDVTLRSSVAPEIWVRYAGRMESGDDSVSDPLIGRA